MLFNSLSFAIFFPIVVVIYFALSKKLRQYWLLAASYWFYMSWNPKYVLLLLGSTVVTYISGRGIEAIKCSFMPENKKMRFKKLVLGLGIAINLAVLLYFKYFNFLSENYRVILNHFGHDTPFQTLDILLPVGISFFIFQAIGYTVDVYRGEIYAEKNFFKYALFVSFFPQLVAGPIERSKNLLRQLSDSPDFNYDSARSGLLIMLWGFFLKLVIADRCAVLVNTVYSNYQSYHGIQLVIASILFTFQIYCDFMGYSVIAKGAAKVLGYELIDNFNAPHFAVSIKDFWRRWHISLSTWFRDYLYFPLGGSRCSKFKKERNLLIVFAISGLWHGSNWTYVIWGLLHGIYQVIEDILLPSYLKFKDKYNINTESFSFKFLNILKTFFLVSLGLVFFRSDTVTDAVIYIKNSFDLSNIGILFNGGLYQLGLNEKNMTFLFIGLFSLLVSSLMRENKINVEEWIQNQNIIFRYMLYWGAIIMIMLSSNITGQEFIYFQF